VPGQRIKVVPAAEFEKKYPDRAKLWKKPNQIEPVSLAADKSAASPEKGELDNKFG